MKEKVIFEGYDVYHKVKPSQVADLLRQTKYKDALERVERGELVFQHCWLWKNGSDYPIDWDCDVFFMQKDDTVEKFFERVLKHLDEVTPEFSTFGYGTIDWEFSDFVENIIGSIDVLYEDGEPYLYIDIEE
ncbi:MAG: hypothetical protein IJA95_07180 [Bacteroidaceae bacterium]|nr:hypothetical protein [Bacteroidaceae bacterium]